MLTEAGLLSMPTILQFAGELGDQIVLSDISVVPLCFCNLFISNS